jgi:hypothetical protein
VKNPFFATILCAVILTSAAASQAAEETCKPVAASDVESQWQHYTSLPGEFTKGASGDGYQCLNSPTTLVCRIMTGNDPNIVINTVTRDSKGAIVRGPDGSFAKSEGSTAGDCAQLAMLIAGYRMSMLKAASEAMTSDAERIESRFHVWEAAFVARSAKTLLEISSPDFVQVEGRDPINRDMAIGMPTHSPDYRIESVNIESAQVTVSADAGQLKGVMMVRQNFSGRVYNTRKAVSENWVRKNGQWLLVREELVEMK